MPTNYRFEDEFRCAFCNVNSYQASLCYHPDLEIWRCEECCKLAIEAWRLGREVDAESAESAESLSKSEEVYSGVEVKLPAANSKAVKESSRLYAEFLFIARRLQGALRADGKRRESRFSEYRKAEMRAGVLRALELAETYQFHVELPEGVQIF